VTAAACFFAAVFLISAIERCLFPLKYGEYVTYYADLYGVPEEVVYAVIRTESRFDPKAVSRAGARGLMQLMPMTYQAVAEEIGRVPDEALAFDPGMNIQCGVYLLSRLYEKYRVWDTVYAAYNAGETAVDRWLADPKCSEKGRLIVVPYGETREYVKRVRHAAEIYQKRMR